MLRGAPLEEVPQEQLVSPKGAPFEEPLARASLLRKQGHSCLDVTPAIMCAGVAATHSLLGRNSGNHLSFAYLTAIATDEVLSELQRLRLYATEALPDIAHEIYGGGFTVGSTCAVTNVQRRSVGEKSGIIPNTFKPATILPAKLKMKAVVLGLPG